MDFKHLFECLSKHNFKNKITACTTVVVCVLAHIYYLLRLNQMLSYALCLLYHSNTEAVLFAYLSSGWATTTGRLLGSKMGNSIKCLSQGCSDALFCNLSITIPALFQLSHAAARYFTKLPKALIKPSPVF